MIKDILTDINIEYDRALGIHGDFKSLNDGFSILFEEFDELKDAIRAVKNQNKILVCQKEKIREEAVQLAAMSVKLINYLEA